MKGIAYAGALAELEKRNILGDITRVAGTSAGAITAVLVALGASAQDVQEIVGGTNFKSFMDGSWGIGGDAERLLSNYGIYYGDAFKDWMRKQIYALSGNPDLTFGQLADLTKDDRTFRELHIVGTNLSMQIPGEFSAEYTPTCPIWWATRISMSIPLFFECCRDSVSKNIWVDGGVTWNYPLDIFDDTKFKPAANASKDPITVNPGTTKYDANHIYNQETLGFRLDSADEIKAEKKNWQSPPAPINNLVDYTKALIGFMHEMANRLHLKDSDWDRSIFIDTGNIGTTQFDLSKDQMDMLIQNGRDGVKKYFAWFDDPNVNPKPINKV